MLVLLLNSRVVLEYIKAVSKPTKIDVERQSILMACVKMITIFFSFCLFKLLNKLKVYSNAAGNEEILWHRGKYYQSQKTYMHI